MLLFSIIIKLFERYEDPIRTDTKEIYRLNSGSSDVERKFFNTNNYTGTFFFLIVLIRIVFDLMWTSV